MPTHHLPLSFTGENLSIPEGKRLPRGVKAHGVGSEPVLLKGPMAESDSTRLRVTIALDHRAETELVVTTAIGEHLGSALIRCGGQFQPFDLPIGKSLPTGTSLCLRANGAPVWLVTGGSGMEPAVPHLWSPEPTGDATATALALLAAPHCRQQFGWKDGCITDALVDLHRATGDDRYRRALQLRLERFVIDGQLSYEDPLCHPREGRIYGIEGGLPVAALMNLPGGAFLSDILLNMWRDNSSPAEPTIQDGHHLSTEGCYVIAWPLALMARRDRDPALARWALHQLKVRRERLVTGESVWQARNGIDEPGRLAGWARGVAWYLLGQVRTSAALEGLVEIPGSITDEIRRISAWSMRHQRADGLWGNFLDDPASGVDTSGSAGIAAGLAHGAALGLLGPDAHAAAHRAAAGLAGHLDPDGWLTGCAQENKGGDALQRSDYRVRAPFALGLWGQLVAVLHHPAVARIA